MERGGLVQRKPVRVCGPGLCDLAPTPHQPESLGSMGTGGMGTGVVLVSRTGDLA